MFNVWHPKPSSITDGSFGGNKVANLIPGLFGSVKVDMNHEMRNWTWQVAAMPGFCWTELHEYIADWGLC